jgi:hypothetical protein
MSTVTVNNIFAVGEAGEAEIIYDASVLGSDSANTGSVLVADGSGQTDWKSPYVLNQ